MGIFKGIGRFLKNNAGAIGGIAGNLAIPGLGGAVGGLLGNALGGQSPLMAGVGGGLLAQGMSMADPNARADVPEAWDPTTGTAGGALYGMATGLMNNPNAGNADILRAHVGMRPGQHMYAQNAAQMNFGRGSASAIGQIQADQNRRQGASGVFGAMRANRNANLQLAMSPLAQLAQAHSGLKQQQQANEYGANVGQIAGRQSYANQLMGLGGGMVTQGLTPKPPSPLDYITALAGQGGSKTTSNTTINDTSQSGQTSTNYSGVTYPQRRSPFGVGVSFN